MWRYKGQQHPPFAQTPGPDQESVWDYPRPPAIVHDDREVRVVSAGGDLIAEACASQRVLETASPPTFYLAPEALTLDLSLAVGNTHCEWKGPASYFQLDGEIVGWCYPSPSQRFTSIAGWLSFYPSRVQCFVSGERVSAQPGSFYGGWVTKEVLGPFKGEPGTLGW
ncbi:MAG: DUF427 domain-containing protein [Gammaproteobacteria bacterium TMED134]|nr:MAG: DUF427 domain-containing protein [Gammaproteobacteria bacterium TMED134]